MPVPLRQLFASILPSSDEEIYKCRTDLYEARIIDNKKEGTRKLFLDIQLASGMKFPSGALLFKYTLLGKLAHLTLPHISHALFIGLGAGTEPRHLLLSHPEAKVDIAEPDTKLPALAKQFFLFPLEDKRIRIFYEDGLSLLSRSKYKYDFLRLDAFDFGTFIPRHLLSLQAVSLMRSRLSPRGLLAANIVSPLEGEQSAFFRSTYKTFSLRFPHISLMCTAPEEPEKVQNISLLASATKPLTQQQLLKAAGDDAPLHELAQDCIWQRKIETSDVPLITG
ncbi:MAG: fused MFS/spermidine synthase [Candidatus Micrarchaeia archaeon]|jgi:spermidine synthase